MSNDRRDRLPADGGGGAGSDDGEAGRRPPASAGPGAAAPPPLESLLLRMRHGDREAAAEFIQRYGERIRRRVRSRLTGATRRVFDSNDILSTLSRRLDDYVAGRKLQAETEAQLWSLVFRIADNATVDKSRIMARLRAVEGEDTPFAAQFLERIERAQAAGREGAGAAGSGADDTIERAIEALEDPIDRQILTLWLTDTPHTVTAGCVGLTPAAVRKRWQAIKMQLRAALDLGEGAPDRPGREGEP